MLPDRCASHHLGSLLIDTSRGTEDIVIPASNALNLLNAIPGAWLPQFPHGRHAFMAQYPRALVDLINSFLALSIAHNAE